MLRSLYISNYALIEETRIEFGKGLNILTGETGAGKSLLLGAIGLILGKRLDSGFIFNPDKKCVVEAVFQDVPAQIIAELQRMEDFDVEENTLIIRREASANGKSRAFVNDTPVAVQVLKDITGLLVDLHGQHQNQMLLAPEFQLRLLDQFGGTATMAVEFGQLLGETNKIRKQISNLEAEEAEARKQQDYFNFLLQELTTANLSLEEEAQLEAELELLEHAGEIKEGLGHAIATLYDDETSAYSQLSEALNRLEKISRINPAIGQQYSNLQEVRIGLQDAMLEISKLNDNIDLDPRRLETMQERSDFLNRLKKKFNAKDIAELIVTRDDYKAKASHFESLGGQIDKLKKQLAASEKSLVTAGLALEKKRKEVAQSLNAKVDDLLRQVGLENAKFEVQIARNESASGFLLVEGKTLSPAPDGLNTIDFRIRTNAGTPLGALSQIASGGEISRVMLAIKAALAERAALSVLIFDEIDTGISGETANKVGRVMGQLAERYQLIAITHLPQIAARGHHHFRIYKEVQGGVTTSRVSALSENDRVMELAYMLSGADPSESAIRNAKELISSGKR
jgi:DNA repair protein RecN (Recombination protein N)